MSKGQTIAKLEAMLARIHTRAAQPRPVAVAAATAPEVVEVVEIGAPQPQLDPPSPLPPAPLFDLVDEPVEDLETTQSRAVPVRTVPMRTETDIVLEVEVQATTHETVLAVAVDESSVPEPLDSRERLVAAAPSASAEPAIVQAAEPQPPPVIAVQLEEPVEELAAEEVDEAPASSRRPVAPPPEERLEEMAFGSVEPEPPRHTPPPESGRLPAAPEVEFDGDITGVRNAAKSAHPAARPASDAIVPDATIADLAASDEVADVVAAAYVPGPTTFVGVLDQSIAL